MIDIGNISLYHSPVMNKLALPIKIDPLSYAKASRNIKGSLEVSSLPRLAEELASDKGEVKYDLNFKIDEEGYSVIEVQAQAGLHLVCQRCMGPFVYEVKLHSNLSPVADETKAKDLPERFEAWPLSEEMTVSPKEIIEEELLLSLPLVPMHKEAECPAATYVTHSTSNETEATYKPFAVLKKLKGE